MKAILETALDNIDQWLTRTPADQEHREGCNCLQCHKNHIEMDEVIENAIYQPMEYRCCVDEHEDMMADRIICRSHPFSYIVSGFCQEC